jgi:acetolactate synthase-1/2/3 large subunit
MRQAREKPQDGGGWIAERLRAYGVELLFTLCGGHISPILVAAKQAGIRVIDTRHEATAVFAADAVARLTGKVGVAAVTAGPGMTNALTAAVNARFAESPLVVFGGATATVLRGRGALQDMDQLALAHGVFKACWRVERLRELVGAVDAAFFAALEGVPGPVFVELPVDLLYPERVVRDWYGVNRPQGKGSSFGQKLEQLALRFHLARLFQLGKEPGAPAPLPPAPEVDWLALVRAARALKKAKRPVLLLGSQVVLDPQKLVALVEAVEALRLPVYLSGTARGLLGRSHPLLLRHRRREALREADCVVLAGVPCDFRLEYGRSVSRRATLIAIHRSPIELYRNRRPTVALLGDPASALLELAKRVASQLVWESWLRELQKRDQEREAEIQAAAEVRLPDGIQPLKLLRVLDALLPQDSLLIGDGGDFVGTAAYTVRPPQPLSWLDPGPFGTLGVGGGFALGAKLARPSSEVWVLWGDGSVAYSLAEFDTFARHGVPIIGLVGNDASWAQIARDQVELLGDPVGTELVRADYHRAAEALGGVGIRLQSEDEIAEGLTWAQKEARAGKPVLVNAHLGRSLFRKGSISL